MAIVKKVSYRGQKSITTLGGHIRLEEGSNRLVLYNHKAQGEVSVGDGDGIKTFNVSDGKEIIRDGYMPDGTFGQITVKEGSSVEDVFS